MMRSRNCARIAVLVLPAALAWSCSKTDTTPPVATVSVAVSKKSVALGSVVDLAYKFQVAADAKIGGDYRVFVHLNRENGTTIWHDDHELPEQFRTSRWQPGQTIEYTRTRFIPTFAYVGPATIEVGLYRDDERLPLVGPDPADRESPTRSYKVAAIELLPRSQSIQVFRLSGWQAPEFSPEDPTVDWQWTQKVATLSLKNPKQDVTFFLEFDTRSDLFGNQPQQVSVYCGDTRLATFAASTNDVTLQRVPATAQQLGGGEMAEFRIEVDRIFVPARMPNAGSDARELGIRVYHAVIEYR